MSNIIIAQAKKKSLENIVLSFALMACECVTLLSLLTKAKDYCV
jgi:hypothetical protein